MKAEIYAEGGGPPGRITNIRCREGFTKLLENCGLDVGNFDVIACGGRGEAWNDFQDAHADAQGTYYVALLIDSERPIASTDETWKHLEENSNWVRPQGAVDDQVLFMTRCMETWIVADLSALQEQFGPDFQTGELPELNNLEEVSPGNLEGRLEDATLFCPNSYGKGRNSFEVLGKLDPNMLEEHLPSFQRVRRILSEKLR